LRGMNSGVCAGSGEVIMSSLFEKKRLQLCAVWVTTPTSPSPFEELNNSVRKYDYVRAKYIGAFIDCSKLCRRRKVLESFLNWTLACRLDLPNFYYMSAGPAPRRIGRGQILSGSGVLWSAKRHTNEALATMALQDLKDIDLKGLKDGEKLTEVLRDAYTCYLRLYCPLDDSLWERVGLNQGKVTEVNTLCKVYIAYMAWTTNTVDDYKASETVSFSMLQEAAAKCGDLFSSIKGSHIPRNKNKPRPTCKKKIWENQGSWGSKKRIKQEKDEKNCEQSSIASINQQCTSQLSKGHKEKVVREAKKASVKKTIVVAVPKGLAEGETFDVNVRVGTFRKKFELTVPNGQPPKVKFSLSVPACDEKSNTSISAKKQHHTTKKKKIKKQKNKRTSDIENDD